MKTNNYIMRDRLSVVRHVSRVNVEDSHGRYCEKHCS